MAPCKRIRSRRRRTCAGDRDKLITVVERNPVELNDGKGGIRFEEGNPQQFWASLVTHNVAESLFDGVNENDVVTHTFSMAWRNGSMEASAQNWIVYKDQYFRILTAENAEERDETLILRCNLRGKFDVPVNVT